MRRGKRGREDKTPAITTTTNANNKYFINDSVCFTFVASLGFLAVK